MKKTELLFHREEFLLQYKKLSLNKKIAFKAYVYAAFFARKIPPFTLAEILSSVSALKYLTPTPFTIESMADYHIHSITKRSTKQSYVTN